MIRNHLKNYVLVVASLTFSATISHAEDASIPEHVFEADCNFFFSEDLDEISHANDENHQKISKGLTEAVEFAKTYQGQMVYIRLSVEASNSAGRCDMYDQHFRQILPDDVPLADVDRKYGIRHLPEEVRSGENLDIWARTLEHNGGSTAITLPKLADLPDDSLVVTQRFSAFYVFEGLAVPHYHSGNGFEGAGFNPIQDSAPFWREISKIRN